MNKKFQTLYQAHRSRWQKEYKSFLQKSSFTDAPTALRTAVNYSLAAGGKRLRPVLALESARLAGLSKSQAMYMATALECIHTYSLVHDDLPALDNDDLRRGKPSSHKKFGEDVAILVGDTLQAMGFELLSLADLPAQANVYFARAIGAAGMVGGQYKDIKSQKARGKAYLDSMHTMKTGMLIEASIVLPFLAKTRVGRRDIELKTEWARALGRLFQVVDDILDETATSKNLGKSAGKDRASGKLTFISVYGLNQARQIAEDLCLQLESRAASLFTGSDFYRQIPAYILNRKN